VILAILIFIAPNTFARNLSDTQRYNDGFSNGAQAAATDKQQGNPFNSVCDPTGRYTSGGGHTTFYCNGWVNGYTSAWNNGGQQQQQVQPSQQQSTGSSGENFASECNAIQAILVQPCSQVVNPDGTLTVPDGQTANTCIRNGIVLGVGGLILSGGNIGSLPPIISALHFLASRTGCDGVVNWNYLDFSQLSLLRQIFH
jgi:hypothetical protein